MNFRWLDSVCIIFFTFLKKNAFALPNGLYVIHLSGNVSNVDNSSSLDCATQQTSRTSTNPNSSLMVITTTNSITPLLESTSSKVTAEINNHDQAKTIQGK